MLPCRLLKLNPLGFIDSALDCFGVPKVQNEEMTPRVFGTTSVKPPEDGGKYFKQEFHDPYERIEGYVAGTQEIGFVVSDRERKFPLQISTEVRVAIDQLDSPVLVLVGRTNRREKLLRRIYEGPSTWHANPPIFGFTDFKERLSGGYRGSYGGSDHNIHSWVADRELEMERAREPYAVPLNLNKQWFLRDANHSDRFGFLERHEDTEQALRSGFNKMVNTALGAFEPGSDNTHESLGYGNFDWHFRYLASHPTVEEAVEDMTQQYKGLVTEARTRVVKAREA